MTDQLEGQESFFAQDTPSTKTYPDSRPQTGAKTSRRSSRTSSASSSRKLPIFAYLIRADGPTQEASMAWEPTGNPFPWLGDCMMRSTTVYRSGEKDIAFWLTSPDLQRLGFCLTLNLSERPRVANPTKLSQILEQNPNPKYALSARACQGILNRAERRGKELPPELKAALETQAKKSPEPSTQATTKAAESDRE